MAFGSFCLPLALFSLISLAITSDPAYILPFILSSAAYVTVRILEKKSLECFDRISKESVPSVFVKRSGEIFSTTPDQTVPGDLVCLKSGDVIFFDARLVYTENFRTLEKHVCDGDGIKDASFESYIPDLEKKEQKKKVFSCSVVSHGYSYAIVCSVSPLPDRSHVSHRKLGLTEKTKKIASIFNISLLFYILIFTVLQFFFSDSSGYTETLNAFVTALSVAAGTACEFYYALADTAVAKTAYIKSAVNENRFTAVHNLSKLSSVKDITLLAFNKLSSLCPASPYIEKIYAYGTEYSIDSPIHTDKCRSIIYTAALAGGSDPAESATNEAIEAVLNRMHLTTSVISELYPVIQRRKAEKLSLFDCSAVNFKGQSKLCVRGSAQHILHRCTEILTEDGKETLSSEKLKELFALTDEYEKNGCQLIACASKFSDVIEECNSELCLEGLLILPVSPTKQAVNAITRLHEAGIKTLLFCDDISDSNYELAKSLNIVSNKNQVLTSYEFNSANINILKLQMENYRLFQGFSGKEKRYVLEHLRKTGDENIGVLSEKFSDSPYSGRSYTLFCVNSSLGEYRGAEALKYLSDVSVPNVLNEGGIIGVKELIERSKSLFPRCIQMLEYLMFSAFSSIFLSAFSSVLGIFSLSSAEILISSLLMGLVGAFSVISTPLNTDIKQSAELSLSKEHLKNAIFGSLIATAMTVLSVSVLHFSNEAFSHCSSVGFYSVIFTSLTAFCLCVRKDCGILSKKEWRFAIPSVCTVLFTVLLSCIFPKLSSSLGISVFSFRLFIYTLPPSLVLTALDLIRRIKLKKF